MKLLKKLLLGALALTTSLGLFTACGDDSSDDSSSVQAPATSSVEASSEATSSAEASSEEASSVTSSVEVSSEEASSDDTSSEEASSETSSEEESSSEESSSVCEAHTGGTATCKTLAECADCGTPYGELDATNHESEEFTYVDNEDGTHTKKNACCEAVVETVEHVIDGWDTTNEEYDYGMCICGAIDETVSFKKSITDERKEMFVTATDASITMTGCDTYASVKDITVGDVSLGNDISALVFADADEETVDLADRKDLHGETEILVTVVDESGYEHVISVPVLLVTGTISTTKELYDATYPVKYEPIDGAVKGEERTLNPVPVVRSGYYKLANDINFKSDAVKALGDGYYLDPANEGQGRHEGTVSARTNGWFEGTIDGCGYKITVSGTSYGTFNSLNGATIKNVDFVDGWYYGSIGWACALAYTMENTTLEDVSFSIVAASGAYGTGVGAGFGYLTTDTFKGNTLKNVTIDLLHPDGRMLAVGSLFGSGMDDTNTFENVKLVNCSGIAEYGHDGTTQYKDVPGFKAEITLATDVAWNEIPLSEEQFDIWLVDPEGDDDDGIPDGETVVSVLFNGAEIGDSLTLEIGELFTFADLGERVFTVKTLYGEGVHYTYTVPVTVVQGDFEITEITAEGRQDVILSAETQSIDVASYVEDYTVSGINFGTYSFGNDPANLVVPQAVKEDTASHGETTITVIAERTDSVAIITVPVLLITAEVSTAQELYNATYPVGASKGGYVRLAQNIAYSSSAVTLNNADGATHGADSGYYFTGTLDGNGKTITASETSYGIFNSLNGATIKNLSIVDNWCYGSTTWVTLFAKTVKNTTIQDLSITISAKSGSYSTGTGSGCGWLVMSTFTGNTMKDVTIDVTLNAEKNAIGSLFGTGFKKDTNTFEEVTVVATSLVEVGRDGASSASVTLADVSGIKLA